MLLAPPIVSQAYIFRTRFWSTNIFFIEKARDNVTARGRPSGMATTTTVIARMKNLSNSGKSVYVFQVLDTPFYIANLINNITRIKMAE